MVEEIHIDNIKYLEIIEKIYTPKLRKLLTTIPNDLTRDSDVCKIMEKLSNAAENSPRGTFIVSLLMLTAITIDETDLLKHIEKFDLEKKIENYIQ